MAVNSSRLGLPSTMTMKVVISVILEIRKAEIDVAFLASAAFTMTLIIGISGSSIKGIWGGNVLLINSTDSVKWGEVECYWRVGHQKCMSSVRSLIIASPKIPARDLSLLFSVFLTSFICNDDLMLKFVLPLKWKPFVHASTKANKK